MMKTAAAILLVLACSCYAPVGYMDVNKVISDSAAGKAFAAENSDSRIDDLKSSASQAIDAYNKSVTAKEPEVDQAAKKRAAERADKAFSAEVKKQQDRSARFEEQLADAIARVAEARGMKLVVPISGRVPYAAPGTDLTGDVMKRLDAAVTTDKLAKLQGDLDAVRAENVRLKRGDGK